MIDQFKTDVEAGLSQEPKTISSKYFYDAKGDALFVEIMKMPEYYLTRAEYEIFSQQTEAIIAALGLDKNRYFELIELGAGNGQKTKELLKVLVNKEFDFAYFPVDISANALSKLEDDLAEEIPLLNVQTQQGEYFKVLSRIRETPFRKVILFLGSNIGNMKDELASKFIYQLGANLRPQDRVFLGVDLIKPKSIILPAYNDKAGITEAFNLNLLHRINRELDANFDLDKFRHCPEYSERDGIAKSFIESKIDQTVTINKVNKTFQFKKGERIHTEISRKYNDEIIKKILLSTDFEILDKLTDSHGYFADYVLNRK
ncbi:L-histidine N(alpha)-methyltransferase [Flavobacteriaceae bacterium F08102]|nr:L-histidine N(alpha)-methyltransferase [Flavobacteriaceae bacterium F08102]